MGAPMPLGGLRWMKGLGGSAVASQKEYLAGRSAKGTRDRRAALYLRVSTAEQRLDLQRDDLAAYAERAEIEVAASYADVAVSYGRTWVTAT